MKTATVTWITYNNYGTFLQAYALQKQIELLGHENVILSDEKILEEYRTANPRKKQSAEAAGPEEIGAKLKRLAEEPGRISRSILARKDPERYGHPYEVSQAAFVQFRKENLKVRYGLTSEMLPALNEEYDAFVCGSDQIWSLFDANFNPYYFLDFVSKKKIAYAPCLGTDRITEQRASQLKTLLDDFSAISAREDVSARQLSELTGREVAWVADPTLLHGREFWEAFVEGIKVPKKKYLLCYFLENRKWYFDYARKLARKLGLTLLLIPNKWEHLQHAFVADFAVGPKEFVALFRDAEYVLTDSYHGSIFSLIFEKQFQYLQRFAEDDPNSQNIRVESLFGYLNLKNRVYEWSHLELVRLDYRALNGQLSHVRRESIGYLDNCLNFKRKDD